MRAFLTQIAKGAYRSDIEEEFTPLLEELIRDRMVKVDQETVRLDTKYRAGTIDVLPSGTAFVEMIGAAGRDLLVEPNNLHGAKNGDYVIVRRLFGKAGRASAKVVKVVQPAFVYSVGYIKLTESGPAPFHIKTDLPMELENSADEMPIDTVFQVDNRTSRSKGRREDLSGHFRQAGELQ